jgi:hypothetical protein
MTSSVSDTSQLSSFEASVVSRMGGRSRSATRRAASDACRCACQLRGNPS